MCKEGATIHMSNISDINIEGMEKSEAAVTYILESLFSPVLEFDGTTEVMISESVKKGCPHIWTDANYRIVTSRLFDWWMHNMPYLYLAMLEDKTFTPHLYDALVNIFKYDGAKRLSELAYNTDGSVRKSPLAEATLFHVDFTKFSKVLYKKLLTDLEKSMHRLDVISDRLDEFVNGLTSEKRYQISYIVCNFMYLLFEVMHNTNMYNWLESTSRYYQEMVNSHAAVYDEALDNPGDFA